MLTPLTQFICDTCHEIIKRPEEGYMEWISLHDPTKGAREIHNFRIVHQLHYSPLQKKLV